MRRAPFLLAACAAAVVGACAAEPSSSGRLELPAAPACDVPLVPRTVLDIRNCGGDLQVDDERLYWSEWNQGSGIWSMPKCGGEPTRLADSLGGFGFTSLRAGTDAIYALSGGTAVVRIRKDGGATTTLVAGFNAASSIELEPGETTALVSAEGYCASFIGPDCVEEAGMIWRVDLTGAGGPAHLVYAPEHGSGQVFTMAVTEDFIYFTGNDNRQSGLQRIARQGGDYQHLADGVERVVADPATGEVFGTSLNGIARWDGSSMRQVYEASPAGLNTFSLDAHFIYVVETDGSLWRGPRAGGERVVLLEGSHVKSVGLDAAAIYAFDCADPAARILQFAR